VFLDIDSGKVAMEVGIL